MTYRATREQKRDVSGVSTRLKAKFMIETYGSGGTEEEGERDRGGLLMRILR